MVPLTSPLISIKPPVFVNTAVSKLAVAPPRLAPMSVKEGALICKCPKLIRYWPLPIGWIVCLSFINKLPPSVTGLVAWTDILPLHRILPFTGLNAAPVKLNVPKRCRLRGVFPISPRIKSFEPVFTARPIMSAGKFLKISTPPFELRVRTPQVFKTEVNVAGSKTSLFAPVFRVMPPAPPSIVPPLRFTGAVLVMVTDWPALRVGLAFTAPKFTACFLECKVVVCWEERIPLITSTWLPIRFVCQPLVSWGAEMKLPTYTLLPVDSAVIFLPALKWPLMNCR